MNRRLVPMPPHVAGGPPKGSIAYDLMMQAANSPPPRRRRRFEDDDYDIYDDRRAWSRVPYPYQFKWDAGWIFVTCLAAFGGLGLLLLGPTVLNVFCLFIAVFSGFMRCVVWLCFRFPLTSWFFVSFFSALIGGRRRRW